MQFYEINVSQIKILKLYAVYNNHKIIQFSNQTREKFHVLSKFSNNFAVDSISSTHGKYAKIKTVTFIANINVNYFVINF